MNKDNSDKFRHVQLSKRLISDTNYAGPNFLHLQFKFQISQQWQY